MNEAAAAIADQSFLSDVSLPVGGTVVGWLVGLAGVLTERYLSIIIIWFGRAVGRSVDRGSELLHERVGGHELPAAAAAAAAEVLPSVWLPAAIEVRTIRPRRKTTELGRPLWLKNLLKNHPELY